MDEQLKALSRTQKKPVEQTANHSTRKWILRSMPWALAVGAIAIAIYLFGERLLPAATVELETVVTLPESAGMQQVHPVNASGDTNAFEGSVLFQASGWIEADPFPHRATALASGVVERVHVLEGQPVAAGDPVATLIQEDLELQLEAAMANLSASLASVEEIHSEHALAEARVSSMRQEIKVAAARRRELADLDARARELGPEVMAQQDIVQAGLRLETQDRAIEALEAQLQERIIEADRLVRKRSVMESMLDQAEVRLKEAQLAYDRTVIRSPIDGIIQRLLVSPGQKKVLMADNPESATVALLFDPDNLQARIDVPLADAAGLRLGQAVLLETEYLPGAELRGHVQRINGEADLQRNTLQAKVAILRPPSGLRPEILCRARFLDTSINADNSHSPSTGTPVTPSGAGSGLQVMVPRSALIDGDLSQPVVWVVDASGKRVERRQLVIAGEAQDGYLRAADGLRPGDRVVVNPENDLRNGRRIKPE